MARTWLIDSRGLAQKVKNAGIPASHQIKDCGANRQCPNCQYAIDNSDISHDWPGLPAGVKFDPSDIELLEHLAAKCRLGDLEPHKFIDEFIPTLEGDEGICYTHPKNLPGAKEDGRSIHFFYRIANAYSSGKRKRRRIQDESNVRWHKTGKTKSVLENGVLKGCKKIMVLYEASKKGINTGKRNWVMYQYHLGTNEDEREGEYVVSKIFYQPQKDNGKNETLLVITGSDMETVQVVPKTPKTNTPDPPREGVTPCSDYGSDGYFMRSLVQGPENLNKPCHPAHGYPLEDETGYIGFLGGESEAVDLSEPNFLYCNEIIDSYYATLGEFKPDNNVSLTQVSTSISDVNQRDVNASFSGISDLENIELDTPPDFHLNDLQFASQDSVFDWLDRL